MMWNIDGNDSGQTRHGRKTISEKLENAPSVPGFRSFVTTFSGGNNRMDGYSYDAAGNVMNDNAGHSFTYDAENRIIQVGTSVFYVYDGDGRRIRKTVSGTSVDFFYDLAGHEIAEMNSSGGWNRGEVFAADRHVATYNWGTTFFNHLDWLGTERSRTALSGAVSETCLSLPFGDGQSCSGSEITPNHLTGKERDSESGLDYFGARFFNSTQGRWASPDWSAVPEAIPYAALNNSQSLNLYSYLHNNPMSQVDPDGHSGECTIFCRLRRVFYETPEEITEDHRDWLLNQAKTDADRDRIRHASADQVNATYNYYHNDEFRSEVDDFRKAAGMPPIGGDLTYEPSPKHGPAARGDVSAAPTDGQGALNNSIQIKPTSAARVAVDKMNNEFVMFRETQPGSGVFHGYKVDWAQLPNEAKAALIKAKQVTQSGRVIP